MDTSSIPLFQLLTSRMSWLSSRQAVLSENVSNADTPNFVAHDLKPLDFQSLIKTDNSAGLTTTNARHIHIGMSQSLAAPEEIPTGDTGTASGSAVSLEQEMIKLSDTQLQYQTATNIYQKAVSMFRTALGGQP